MDLHDCFVLFIIAYPAFYALHHIFFREKSDVRLRISQSMFIVGIIMILLIMSNRYKLREFPALQNYPEYYETLHIMIVLTLMGLIGILIIRWGKKS
ncbi:MAG: hypothetical protein JSV97_00810 [candidate division WOR-3 bacterium]|nr:MAG: hypothetical protein JSV97_00810 [candidate division WOR-3 bacterium]